LNGERDKFGAEELLYGVAAAKASPPSPPGSGLRERLTQSMARGGLYGRFADRIARLFELPVDVAELLLRKVEDPAAFAPYMVEGISMMPVTAGPSLAGAITAFGRLAPGARFPHHAHKGDEVTLVLDGGFRDDSGVEVWRGEDLYKPAGSDHEFVVIGDRVCVAAVVARGGIDYR
jgi:putative transcriptional regulator